MDLILNRNKWLKDGIFGQIGRSSMLFYTLEHAYGVSDGISTTWTPKIPAGTYKCVRGTHQLEAVPGHPPPEPFETFCITGVPDHSGILFHILNFNLESKGCVGLGLALGFIDERPALLSSKIAFEHFMNLQKGCDQFSLQIIG